MLRITKPFILLLFVSLGLLGCELFEDTQEPETRDLKEALYPVLLNGKWGFINAEGALKQSPQFEEATTSKFGIARFREGPLWGYYSVLNNSKITAAEFPQAFDFTEEGLALVRNELDQWKFINSEGDIIIEVEADFVRSFSESMAAFRVGTQWGFINQLGEIVIEPVYSNVGDFSDGLAAVNGPNGWEYINLNGSSELTPFFEVNYLGNFKNGLAAVETVQGWGYLNTEGALAIPIQFDQAGIFSEGLAMVTKDDYIGYINSDGFEIIPPQFNTARSFNEERAAVRIGNRWFFVQASNGKLVRTPAFTGVSDFQNGLALVWVGNEDDPSYGYIDKEGNYVWNPTK